MADFALLESPKLISRKIWVIEKSWNFHTVHIYDSEIVEIWSSYRQCHKVQFQYECQLSCLRIRVYLRRNPLLPISWRDLIIKDTNQYIDKWIRYVHKYTVWKIQDFSITQILREITFSDSWSAESAILTHLEVKNFDLYGFLHFLKAEILPN